MIKTSNGMLTAALHDLDPAPATAMTEAKRRRADDTFARLITTPTDSPGEPYRPRRRWWRLLVPVGLLGAAGVALSALFLGGSAFASWTPTPVRLAPAEASAASATCRTHFGIPTNGAATLLAERRGKWTYVLMAGPNAEAGCIMRNIGKDVAGHVVMGSGGTDPGKAPPVANDRIDEGASQEGAIDEGWLRQDSWLTWTSGYVGSDVRGVTVHTSLGFDVEASVDNGRFAAWWPSEEPSSWSYTVTLADGSTRLSTG